MKAFPVKSGQPSEASRAATACATSAASNTKSALPKWSAIMHNGPLWLSWLNDAQPTQGCWENELTNFCVVVFGIKWVFRSSGFRYCSHENIFMKLRFLCSPSLPFQMVWQKEHDFSSRHRYLWYSKIPIKPVKIDPQIIFRLLLQPIAPNCPFNKRRCCFTKPAT